MNKRKINGIWFYGLSGSGKTTASSFLKEKIFKNSFVIDGDKVRKYISYDLSYNLKDRLIQLNRVLGICRIAHVSNVFTMVSTVYMDDKTLMKLKKLNIKVIKIERDFESLKKFKVYKNKNVVGLDIKAKILNTDVIFNDGTSSFFTDLKKFFIKYT